MIVGRAALSLVGYTNCRLALLRAFIPVSIRPPARPTYPPLGTNQLTCGRSFSTSHSWRSELVQQRQLQNGSPDDGATLEVEPTPKEDEAPESTTSTPWYLQVETPQRASNPRLQRRQIIPKLPPDPPPLLQPILEHISIELGLDELTVLDLRKIDPPPALGANLLMILGTARSEKHLHVSADRFCRWLKTTHKLSPYADGLLGRGELKLKLRRKARRARLLSNVGSSETSNADDGIRTGWICVNVGAIDDGRDPTESFARQEGYVGFGEEAGGAKVVIQMLTAEKREELDLEDLWGKMQRRQERKGERISRGQRALLTNQEVGPTSFNKERSSSDSPSSLSSSPFMPPTTKSNHKRCYHRQSISTGEGLEASQNSEYEGLDESSLEPNIRVPEIPPPERRADSAFSDPQDIQREGSKGHFGDTSKLIALQALVDHLKRLPSQDAIRALGNGADDFDSTPFLSSFYQSYPLFPSADHWECRLAIVCHGITIRHPGYSKSYLRGLAEEMQSSLIDIPAQVSLLIYKTLLFSNREDAGRPFLSEKSLRAAVDILVLMNLRGHDFLTEEIRSDFLVAAVRESACSDRHCRKLGVPRRGTGFQDLKVLLDRLLDKPPTLETELRIMHEHVDQKNWSGFEEHWRGFARDMRPRPKELYLAMFQWVAQRRHQAFVMRILRERVPEMLREEPAVQLDAELAGAVMECLLVAEPSVERMAMDESNDEREWVKLWRRCQRALQEENVEHT